MKLLGSLRARVVLWIGVALTLLFAVTIVGLDLAFSGTTNRAVEEYLQSQLLGLIALAQEDATGELSLPADAINPEFQVADSGLFAVLWDAEGYPFWRSPSVIEWRFDIRDVPAPGEQRQFRIRPEGLPPLAVLVRGIEWELSDGRFVPYAFGVAVSLDPYIERREAFRRNLVGWFVAMLLTVVLVVAGLLAWVLRPLRRLERQVRDVESGARAQIDTALPTELAGLAGNLNALIDTERRRLARYRHMLDDLAHSLKTPLAAMRALLTESRLTGEAADGLDRELDRMQQRVSYQLRRARATGATGIGLEPAPLAPVVEELKQTLDKVYHDKAVDCRVHVSAGAVFRGDRGDLTEIIGNLLDNAYKYCERRVTVDVETRRGRLVIVVGDDGPGIETGQADALLERGKRADESVPGQGIGLAVVRETVELYNGRLEIGTSALGGAALRIELARAGAGA